MGLLEEISFFKNIDANVLYPYFPLLNTPITLFEIFPFIFINNAILFYDLLKKDELNLLRKVD